MVDTLTRAWTTCNGLSFSSLDFVRCFRLLSVAFLAVSFSSRRQVYTSARRERRAARDVCLHVWKMFRLPYPRGKGIYHNSITAYALRSRGLRQLVCLWADGRVFNEVGQVGDPLRFVYR